MMNYLAQPAGAAIEANAQDHKAQLDAAARKQGFPDYATMVAWQHHRSESLNNSHTTPAPRPSPAVQPPSPRKQEEGLFPYIVRMLGGG